MKNAFTLIEILIVVAIIGLLTAVAVPSFLNYRSAADDQMKEVNISTVEAAKDQWAILNNKQAGAAVVWADIADYVGSGINSQSDLEVNGDPITLNDVGTRASY